MSKNLRKKDVKIGATVSVKTDVEGYYSNYGGNPKFFFKSGMIGVVGSVDVPSVRRENVSFVCVDWDCPETGRKERCGVDYNNIVPLTKGSYYQEKFRKFDKLVKDGGLWPSDTCQAGACQRGTSCCQNYSHHLYDVCLHCGNDERDIHHMKYRGK